jgi:hypothetical protein
MDQDTSALQNNEWLSIPNDLPRLRPAQKSRDAEGSLKLQGKADRRT